MILLHYFSILLFLFHTISMLFLTFRLHYFHLRSTIILCVFIKTDDSRKETQLHRSSLEAMVRSRGKRLRLFPYVCTGTKTRSYHRLPPVHASVRQIDASWIYSEWVAQSFHEIARYKPILIDSLRFVNHRSLRSLTLDLIPFSLQENAAVLSFRPTK